MLRPGVYLSEAQNDVIRICRAGDSRIEELISETKYPCLALCEKRSFLIKFDSGNPIALAVTHINIETLPATWLVLCTSRADSSQARVSWHPALGGSNRGRRADSTLDSSLLAVSWRFLGGSSLESRGAMRRAGSSRLVNNTRRGRRATNPLNPN